MLEDKQNYFLRDIAQDIIKEYDGDFSNLKVILPSKRAVLFFRYYLSQSLTKSSWAPDIITISEWISELTTYEELDKTTLLFELFKVVKGYIKEDDPITEFYYYFSNLKFDNFYPFGETLLSDFNEMDAYNVNHNDLFRILKEHAEIESEFDYLSTEQLEAIQQFWKGFTAEHLSKEQKGFIELWKFLPGLYEHFRDYLIQHKKVYGGLNYKLAVDGVKSKTVVFDQSKSHVFAGFNALNTCEIELLSALQKDNDVSFYWDADRMYMEKEEHEAGFFIRKLTKQFPDKIHKHHFTSRILTEDKKPFIHLIGAPSIELQSKAMSQALKQNPEVQNKVSTAIVLSDESFLFPVLYALPEEINHLNVTMGFPITESSLYGFVDAYMMLYKTSEIESLNAFKSMDVLKILRNPFLEKCFDVTPSIKVISQGKRKQLNSKELHEKLPLEIIKPLFTETKTGNELIKKLSDFLSNLISDKENYTKDFSDFEKEFFYHVYTYINQINALLNNAKEQINCRSAYRIVQKGMQNLRVPFTGEPIAGMQIMGVLETRALDFKNLFILGLNEGVWPKISTSPTLIPESIRRGFGLTTIQHQDSIFSYYFYRLLHRSEQVYLYYNNTIGDGKGKEQSRFITQLDKLYPELIASRKTIQLPLYNTQEHDIIIERTDKIQNKVKEYAISTSYPKPSATAINQYLSCSLLFYLKNILRLKEPKTEFEELSQREIGNLSHKALEYLYLPYEGKKLAKDDFKAIKKRVKTCLQEAFNEEFLGDKENHYQLDGEDKIIHHLVRTYIDRVLEHDLGRVPFKIIKNEGQFERQIKIDGNDITINGYIDRIDEKSGQIFLVDYKTGNPKIDKAKSIQEIFDSTKIKKNKAILQMLLYTYLAKERYPTKSITPLLYTVRSLKTDSIAIGKESVTITPDDDKGILTSYMDELKKVLHEMLFSQTPFTKTTDKEQCTYCPYVNICGR